MTINSNVQVKLTEIKGQLGYNLQIINLEATVQDYIDALEEAFLSQPLHRTRNQVTNCEGCQHCCNERISLTSVDVLIIMDFLKTQGIIATDCLLTDFISKYCYILIDGPSVDIFLQRRSEYCIFLSPENKCLYYQARSLVCHTYLCAPTAKIARQLREVVVNTGEDELVRLWLKELEDHNLPLNVNESYDADPDINDYPPNPFTGKQSYSEIKLKDICPEKIWLQLINSETAK